MLKTSANAKTKTTFISNKFVILSISKASKAYANPKPKFQGYFHQRRANIFVPLAKVTLITHEEKEEPKEIEQSVLSTNISYEHI